MNRVVIGTRGSPLARWQAAHVASTLSAAHGGLRVEERIVVTEGDRLGSGTLWNAGGKGVWVKEIEAALLAREIDLAVHSMKDVPGELAPGLVLVAVPGRADVRDAVVSHTGKGLDALPKAARVGTTSLRRACQLKAARPDLDIQILRGNLDTRLRKVADGVVDAAVLACAGLDRLGLAERIAERLPVERMLPAVGQGALAVEARADDGWAHRICEVLTDRETATAVAAERAYLARLGASCRTPVAGYARVAGGVMTMLGLVGRPDGSEIIRDRMNGRADDPLGVGVALADRLLARGAAAILAATR
ncbi:MAG: hydroxymethylbilane synthase [Deltaproteobacteria bacterium]|jgi:hydroxymethylbilane synthase|nr:hydroxymethylbilane synthase [Deltaproteobacteria bacterium]